MSSTTYSLKMSKYFAAKRDLNVLKKEKKSNCNANTVAGVKALQTMITVASHVFHDFETLTVLN
jgi:hypothetical protein